MMNKTKHILTFFLLLCLSSFAQQQATEVTISGTVVDGSNEPIPGASIYVQGKVGAGTSSDVEGKFSIQVVYGDKLIFSFVRSEEHTSELQSLMRISYAVFCLKQKI